MKRMHLNFRATTVRNIFIICVLCVRQASTYLSNQEIESNVTIYQWNKLILQNISTYPTNTKVKTSSNYLNDSDPMHASYNSLHTNYAVSNTEFRNQPSDKEQATSDPLRNKDSPPVISYILHANKTGFPKQTRSKEHVKSDQSGFSDVDVFSQDIPSITAQMLKTHVMSGFPRHQSSPNDGMFDPTCPSLCKCNNTSADCSRHYGKLTYIPLLPKSITFLKFLFNNLTAIYNETFFSNVTQLYGLDLSYNGLWFIGSGVFHLLKRLQSITLNYNNISDMGLEQVLSIRTLKNLGLTAANLGPSANDILYRHPLPGLQEIYLHENNFKVLNFTVFALFTKLKRIALGACRISDIVSEAMPSLQILNLHNNDIATFPETCRNGASLFMNLNYLNLDANDLETIPDLCLPKLQELHLSYNRFQTFPPFMFNGTRFPRLIKLMLLGMQGSALYVTIARNAFSNPTIEVISLSNSLLFFSDDNIVHPDSFANCSSLHEIQLDNNMFTDVSDLKFHRLFGSLPTLRKLFIGYSYITRISQNTFNCLPFIQELYLYGNALVTIPDGAFDHVTYMTVLHLGENKLTVIKETTFSDITRQRLRQLDLSKNPFVCSCDLLWFRGWFVSNRSLFYNAGAGYNCNNFPNMSLAAFSLPDQACLLSSDALTLTVVSICLILIALTVTAMFYRLRWHIRLLPYEAFRGRSSERRRHYLLSGNFQYDIFVSYAAEDSHWVHEHLMPELETQRGLRLCIHQRDFVIGVNIVDNIVDNLVKSKKVMLIFSTHFARSQWCQFELSLCRQYVMDHDDILVVVCLENLSDRVMTGTMLAVLKVTTYVLWEDNAVARDSFWDRLRIAFQEIMS